MSDSTMPGANTAEAEVERLRAAIREAMDAMSINAHSRAFDILGDALTKPEGE